MNFQRVLREELFKNKDSTRALGMQAYMRSQMPYYGVPAPLLKQITKKVFQEVQFKSQKHWIDSVSYLWDGAKFREERYAALHLAEHKTAKNFQDFKATPLYKKLIVEGAWWDFVDVIASQRIGPILKVEPLKMKPLLLKWSTSQDMWLRRTSILSQLKFKEDTDLKFLEACIEPSISSKEFFLRKAIGWALRQYAWTNPRYVKKYVQQNTDRLSGLSKREALKNL